MNIPANLTIHDGRLVMNGADPKDYLRKWQKDTKSKDGTFVNLLTHKIGARWSAWRRRTESVNRRVNYALSNVETDN